MGIDFRRQNLTSKVHSCTAKIYISVAAEGITVVRNIAAEQNSFSKIFKKHQIEYYINMHGLSKYNIPLIIFLQIKKYNLITLINITKMTLTFIILHL